MFSKAPNLSTVEVVNPAEFSLSLSVSHINNLLLSLSVLTWIVYSLKGDAGGPWGARAAEGEDPGGGVQRAGWPEHAAPAAVAREPADQWTDPRIPGVQQV